MATAGAGGGLRVGILVYDGVDVIDAGGPYEVLLTAGRLRERDGKPAGVQVVLISPGGKDVVAYGGMTMTGLADAAGVGELDALIVPGTTDLGTVLATGEIAAAVERLAADAPLVASVCTGAFLIGRAGLTQDVDVTTHWEDVEDLRVLGVAARVIEGVRWVDSGRIVTSGGLTSGIHMTLHLVERWWGLELAQRTARQLDVDWQSSPQR